MVPAATGPAGLAIGRPPRVTPRVRDPDGIVTRLDVAMREALAAAATRIGILGGPGSGKTTALAFVRSSLSDRELSFADDVTRPADLMAAAREGTALIFTTRRNIPGASSSWPDAVWLTLQPWGADECVEWALREPSERRRGFVERAMRILAESGESCPGVLADVWRAAAYDPTIESFPAAVRACLAASGALVAPGRTHTDVCILQSVFAHAEAAVVPGDWPGILHHRSAQRAVAAMGIAARLEQGAASDLAHQLPPALMRGVTSLIAPGSAAVATLLASLDSRPSPAGAANAASLLRIIGHPWRPDGPNWAFAGASLAGAPWSGVAIPGVDLRAADLAGAELCDADLSDARAEMTAFPRADLRRARLPRAVLTRASLRGTNLRWADLSAANLDLAGLADADLTGAVLAGAHLHGASLSGAVLVGAALNGATLISCGLEAADLTGAALTRAAVSGLDLRTVALDHASLDDAAVQHARLEGVVASGLSAEHATFRSTDFTGSVLRGLRLRGATLAGCGLAEVSWPGADLRFVDFRTSTFHMGSSRSGLVGSPIACEGSRTGFYTDDSTEQHYRAPEDIAKADLRGADLRGAVVEGVDFYLVDLRGAKYDADQAEWFRKCRAIMRSPGG